MDSMLSETNARSLLDAVHAAWSRRDLDALLSLYDDDLTYWCNVGGADGGPHVLQGKAEFRTALERFLINAEAVSKVLSFVLHDPYSNHPVGKASIHHRVVHVPSGHVLDGTFRQIVTFRSGKVLRLDEYHDEARMKAFWQLVSWGERPQKDIWTLPPEPKPSRGKAGKAKRTPTGTD